MRRINGRRINSNINDFNNFNNFNNFDRFHSNVEKNVNTVFKLAPIIIIINLIIGIAITIAIIWGVIWGVKTFVIPNIPNTAIEAIESSETT